MSISECRKLIFVKHYKDSYFHPTQLRARIFLQTNRNIEEREGPRLWLALVMDNGAILTFDFETLAMTKGQIKSLDSLNILNLLMTGA